MEKVSKILNNRLIEQQGLNEKTVRLLEEKHSELNQIIDMLNGLEWSEENKAQILQLTDNIELMEFQLQKLWGFPQDKNYHSHWLRNQKCSCPRLDNMDYLGYGQIKSGACLIHGEEARPEFWKNLKQARQG